MRNALFKILLEPSKVFHFFVGKTLLSLLAAKGNIYIGKGVAVIGLPDIDIKKDCYLYVGSNVRLNSRNKGYHINMHSPVKLLCDRPGATIKIGSKTRIHGSCLHAYKLIEIGENCLIAANCQIIDGSGHDLSFGNVAERALSVGGAKSVIIGDNVWVGANSIILPGVTIGMGSVIAAGSVVTSDIPPMVLAGGNPAKIIKSYAIPVDAA